MRIFLCAAAFALLAGCAIGVALAQSGALPANIRFADVTAEAGLHFTHDHFGSGKYYLPESMAGGAIVFDGDGDGWLDVLMLQGGPLPGSTREPSTSVHLRNDGKGRFVDVTAESGLGMRGQFAMGGAAADYDNDGDTDLFVTTYQGNVLLRNDGKGRFADVTARAGVRTPPLATSAAFVDVDADGWLDLFVGRYSDYDITKDRPCGMAGGPGYCGPGSYPLGANRLFLNKRNGSFADVTDSSGIGAHKAHALGIAAADYNDDGRIDLFVASDREPNLLFINDGNVRFKEQAMVAGVAVGPNGVALAGMGVDVADYDNDGRFDLFVTNYAHETNSLYAGRGDGTFDDRSAASGITLISMPYLGWGTRFVDFDGDGYRDLFVVNGHVNPQADSNVPPGNIVNAARPLGYQQPAQIYLNRRNGRFTEFSQAAGPYFMTKQVSRGAAFFDYDNDGDVDVLIVNNNSPATLLRNDTPGAARRVRLTLKGKGCNHHAIGARVRVTAGALTQLETVKSATSYLSDHDRRLSFGLPGTEPATAEIRWPCGGEQRVALAAGASVVVEEAACELLQRR